MAAGLPHCRKRTEITDTADQDGALNGDYARDKLRTCGGNLDIALNGNDTADKLSPGRRDKDGALDSDYASNNLSPGG